MPAFKTIEEYIEKQPERNQHALNELMSYMLEAIPDAKKTFSYGVPAFTLIEGGKRDQQVMIAGFKNHTGFYPHPTTIVRFSEELKSYKTSEGTVQFPLDQSIPRELVIRMVKFRKQQILEESKK